ncbi:Lipopolysaccharide export system permease protein lptG [Porphyromonas macacae]|uniref:Lipopolysaccharide export system permease protein lptG n=1 Tax=Porphyromonas macacae TaxID=28115 RepID=A0A379DI64_9PORP|nr:LptF/LptG family permease [Porphyromonas macacae]SUB78021.1 Lipopolysaccharide export system permease protein lptG [Porphyromonas macacae]
MKGLSRLDRYIIKQFLGTFFFAILLIISISVVFDINEKIDDFLKPEVPLSDILFQYYLNFIPFYANLFSPLFVFIAVIFFTSKLAENSEIIAMLSSGVSFKRLMRPYLISAAIIASVTFVLNNYIIPPGNAKRLEFENNYIKDKKVKYAESVQMELEKGVFLFIGSYSASTNTGYQVSLERFNKRDLESRLIAERAVYNPDSLYHWTLFNYRIRNFDGLYERDSVGGSLDTIIHLQPSEFLVGKHDVETMTTPQLDKQAKVQSKRGMSNAKVYSIEMHKRYASMFSAFILTIIGATLSSRKMKNGMGFNIAIGLGLSFGYILFTTVTSTFAVNGQMPPWLAAWLPNITYIFIAAYLYKKAPR